MITTQNWESISIFDCLTQQKAHLYPLLHEQLLANVIYDTTSLNQYVQVTYFPSSYFERRTPFLSIFIAFTKVSMNTSSVTLLPEFCILTLNSRQCEHYQTSQAVSGLSTEH